MAGEQWRMDRPRWAGWCGAAVGWGLMAGGLCLAGCDGGRTPLAEGEDAAVRGCPSHAACGGGWCVGPQGCDAEWACVDEVPCSAAPPFRVCACAGVVATLAAGCPDARWGLRLDDAVVELMDGEPCDPAGLEPLRLDLSLRGEGFVPGEAVQVRLLDPDTSRWVGVQRPFIEADGHFEVVWRGGLRPGQATQAEVWGVDDQGQCRRDRAWRQAVLPGTTALTFDAQLPADPATCDPDP